MAVVLIAGGVAMTAQRTRVAPTQAATPAQAMAPGQTGAPPAPAANATTVAQASIAPTISNPVPAAPTTAAAQAAAPSSSDTWVVQVAAFSSHDRSQALVQRLTQSGFSAFEVPTEASRGLLYYVRVGPFKTAGEADQARAKLQSLTELESAFVRSLTSLP
jgi:cell division septation protein DedD